MKAAKWGIVLLVTGPVLAGCGLDVGPSTEHENRSYEVPGAGTVQVTTDAGRVEVVGADTRAITVQERLSFSSDKRRPTPEHPVENGVLHLRYRCPSGITIGYRVCEVSYRVTVPRGTSVIVRTDSGRARVTGVGATTSVRTDSGAITTEDIRGSRLVVRSDSGSLRMSGPVTLLDAKTDSGSIDGWALRARTATARSGSGSVRLGFASAPDQATATSDSGSIRFTVPDLAYAVTAESDSGRERIGVIQDPAAPRHLTARSDSGSITVGHP